VLGKDRGSDYVELGLAPVDRGTSRCCAVRRRSDANRACTAPTIAEATNDDDISAERRILRNVGLISF
jgi:hypothetical protein